MTHQGMYRYNRLNFGISCAPEMYNKIIQQIFQDLPGVRNIYDDVIVYGSTEQEHDQNLLNVLNRLSEKGLTLNKEKCQFNMKYIQFMGHVLSGEGISLDQSKVKDLLETRESQSVAEIKSFLGLVNFMGKFIPNLATITEPMYRLTHKNTKFGWKAEQSEAFKLVKEKVAKITSR